MRALAPHTLASLPVASGATTPVPTGGAGSLIWSTTTNSTLAWDGSQWTEVAGAGGGGGGGDVVGPASATDNAIARFNSTTGQLIQDSVVSIDDVGVITIPAQASEPSVPASDSGHFYARSIAGRIVPKWLGPSGVDYPLSPHFGFNNVRAWRGGATSAAATFAATIGAMPYSSASPGSPLIATLNSTSLLTQSYRSTISSGATAGGIAYIRSNSLNVWRGNATGLGGFFVVHRFALSGTLRSGLRCFAGLVDVVSNPTNVNPTNTTTPGGIGLATAAETGNWKLVNNITGTARAATDLGTNFPVNNTDLMEVALWCAPNDSGISYQVTNLSTGNTTSGTITTNIPASGTFMAPCLWVTNNATAAAQTLEYVSTYVETDY